MVNPLSGYDVRYEMKKNFARNFARLRNAQKGGTFPKITAPVTDRISYDLARQNGILQMRNEPLFDNVIFSSLILQTPSRRS